MSPLFYVLCWLALSAVVIAFLWYVAERAPLMDDGWQEHDSDRCPVEPLTQVDLLFENGQVIHQTTAGMWFWTKVGDDRIVAYRVRDVRA